MGGRGSGRIPDVIIAAAQFVMTLTVMIGLLILVPDIALLLPDAVAR